MTCSEKVKTNIFSSSIPKTLFYYLNSAFAYKHVDCHSGLAPPLVVNYEVFFSFNSAGIADSAA
jgi:hypothetical protein